MPRREAEPNAQPRPEPGDAAQMVAAAQRLATLQHYPCKCREPACKRAKRCVDPQARCLIEKTQALPVRVLARAVAAGRRLLQESAMHPDACDQAGPQPAGKSPFETALPTLHALLYCLGKDAEVRHKAGHDNVRLAARALKD